MRMLAVMLFFVLLPAGLMSQTDTTAVDTVLFPKIRRISVGDKLSIFVAGHEELTKTVDVERDGTIKFPYMKDIKVEGLTMDQFNKLVTIRLNRFILGSPEVIAQFAKIEIINVVILGQVNAPGVKPMPATNTIQGAISAASPNERSDMDKIRLIRKNRQTGKREEYKVELERFILETGDVEGLPPLKDGDIIFVPSKIGAINVNVLGEVRSPGNYALFPGANVVDALFLAGGPEENSSIRNVKLISKEGDTVLEKLVDVEGILRAEKVDIPLVKAGDIIFVPRKLVTWKTVISVARDIATILTLILLFSRAKII